MQMLGCPFLARSGGSPGGLVVWVAGVGHQPEGLYVSWVHLPKRSDEQGINVKSCVVPDSVGKHSSECLGLLIRSEPPCCLNDIREQRQPPRGRLGPFGQLLRRFSRQLSSSFGSPGGTLGCPPIAQRQLLEDRNQCTSSHRAAHWPDGRHERYPHRSRRHTRDGLTRHIAARCFTGIIVEGHTMQVTETMPPQVPCCARQRTA